MERHLPALRASNLFAGMDDAGILRLLDCVGAKITQRDRDSYFMMQDEQQGDISVVVLGEAVGERLLASGKVVTVSEFGPGDSFGDVLSGSSESSIVSVRAKTPCAAVCFAFDNILTCCIDSRDEQIALLRNLVGAIADKYFLLNGRVSILVQNTLRGKVASYLLDCAHRMGRDRIEVPHNREEMASYLNCDRSALSREISRMAAEGLFAVSGRNFILNDRRQLGRYVD